MNKRMRELQTQITAKAAEGESYLRGENGKDKDVTKANERFDEAERLQKEFDAEERLEKLGKAGVPAEGGAGNPKPDSIKAFADAARAGFKAMNEGTPADGGYTVPEDISTKVNEYKQNKFNLATLIDSENVTTNKGSRTYKTRAQATGFTKVGEGGKAKQTGAPKYSRINYTIAKYMGYLPVTNELLEDSDAAIAETVMKWLADEGVATDNAQILAKINEKEATALTGIKDIKKAINVTLSAFKGSVAIITNDDGIQYLDTLEDKNGRPLLSPDPARPMEARLTVGFRTIPVVQVPNEVLATAEGGKVPFIMGDLFEYMKKFDRKQLTLTQSNTAAVEGFNAFEEDMTLFKGIMREDFVVKDAQAIVRGEITVTA